MAEISVNRIERTELEKGGLPAQAAVNRPSDATTQPAEGKAPALTAKDASKEAPKPSTNNLGMIPANTSLRFMVNEKTKEVSILIVDRQSNKVLFTIPPDAVKDLPPGELLQFNA
jgi:uncharacterized FlaG/YvyC family protein